MLLQTLVYKFLFRCLLSVVLSIYQEVELLHTSNVMFTILSNQTGFHNSCTISHSHQQCTRVPISLQLCQHLLFSVCFFIVFVLFFLFFILFGFGFGKSRSKGCRVISLCSFDLHFPHD